MKWVTREKAKVDRIACPWLVKKFVDPKAEFLFVPRENVLEVAKEQGAIPYDSPGAELDRKSTRLNSSHTVISYAVFCLKKKSPAASGGFGQLPGPARRRRVEH